MVISEFYESFLLSKSGRLHAEKSLKAFSPDLCVTTVFKNIKTQIEDARKIMRNEKVMLFRKSNYLQSPIAFAKAIDADDNDNNFKNRFLNIITNMIDNKYLKKFFYTCAALNILLIYYDFSDLPKYTWLITQMNSIFSFIFLFEITLELISSGPWKFFKRKSFEKLDLITFFFIAIDVILRIIDGNIYYEEKSYLDPCIDGLKIMRIFKLMKRSNFFFFRSMSKLMKEIFIAVFRLWDFLAIMFIAWLVCSFIGLELFYIPLANLSEYLITYNC